MTLALTVTSGKALNQEPDVGRSHRYAKEDHSHGTPDVVVPPDGAAPATTVTSETSFGQAASAGSAATYSKGDHTHGTPANPAPSASGSVSTSATVTAGVSATYSRGDHSHGAMGDTLPAGTTGYTLIYNGSAWVAAPVGTSYVFAIASFTATGFSTGTQLIGSGDVNAIGSVSFSATYNNGPATNAHVSKSGWADLTMTGTGYVGPTTNSAAIPYPTVGGSVVLTLHALNGSASSTSTKTANYYNNLFVGISTNISTDTWTEADIEGLGNAVVSDDNTRTWAAVTAGSGERVALAWPSRLATPTFYVGGFEVTFDRVVADVSITNANGYTEDYEIYLSSQDNLGATIVVTA